jgi:Fe-S-cluster-containing hydrogenase component 2
MKSLLTVLILFFSTVFVFANDYSQETLSSSARVMLDKKVQSNIECSKACDNVCAKVCLDWHFDHSHDSTHPIKICDQWQNICLNN